MNFIQHLLSYVGGADGGENVELAAGEASVLEGVP